MLVVLFAARSHSRRPAPGSSFLERVDLHPVMICISMLSFEIQRDEKIVVTMLFCSSELLMQNPSLMSVYQDLCLQSTSPASSLSFGHWSNRQESCTSACTEIATALLLTLYLVRIHAASMIVNLFVVFCWRKFLQVLGLSVIWRTGDVILVLLFRIVVRDDLLR